MAESKEVQSFMVYGIDDNKNFVGIQGQYKSFDFPLTETLDLDVGEMVVTESYSGTSIQKIQLANVGTYAYLKFIEGVSTGTIGTSDAFDAAFPAPAIVQSDVSELTLIPFAAIIGIATISTLRFGNSNKIRWLIIRLA